MLFNSGSSIDQIDDLIKDGKWKDAWQDLAALSGHNSFDIQIRKLNVLTKLQRFDEAESTKNSIQQMELGNIDNQLDFLYHRNYLYWVMRRMKELESSLQETKKLLEQSNSKVKLHSLHFANYYRINGLYHWQKGELDIAEQNYFKAEEYFDLNLSKQGKKGKASIIMLLGLLNRHRGNLEEAVTLYMDSAKIFKELSDKQNYAKVINNLGTLYSFMGEYAEATEHLELALETNISLNNKHEISLILNNLGLIERNTGNLAEALDRFGESYKYAEELELDSLKSMALINSGLVYRIQGQLKMALDYYLQALALVKLNENKNRLAYLLPNIATIYVLQGKFDEAIDLYNEVKNIYLKLNNPELMYIPNQMLSRIYTEKGQISFAQELIEENISIAEKDNKQDRVALSMYNLISIQLNQNDIDSAKKTLHQLYQVKTRTSEKRIEDYYSISELLIYKHEVGSNPKDDLVELLSEYAHNESLALLIRIKCYYYLMETLLHRLADTGDRQYLRLLYEIQDKLLELAEKEKMYRLLFTVKLLKSKLYLLELNITRAREIMDEVHRETTEMGYYRLAQETKTTMEAISSGSSKWLQMDTDNLLMNKRIEAFDIIKFVRTKGDSFFAVPTF